MPRGLYYKRMENGWTVCITIPLHALLFGESSAVVNVLAVVFIVLFAVIAILTVRNMMESRRAKRAGGHSPDAGGFLLRHLPRQFPRRHL